MAINLNVNDMHKWNAVEEFKEPPEDMVPFHEEMIICKTEVKEEVYDCELTVNNIEFINVQEDHVSLAGNNFHEENLEIIESTDQLLNEDLDVGHCELNLSLVNHVGIHAEDKPFKCTYKNCRCSPEQEQLCRCDTCRYATTTRTTLNRHILVKHSEQKKYKCKDCDYATHLKAHLVQHSRIHTNEKPFRCTYKKCKCGSRQEEICGCDTCEYTTAYQTSLRTHILLKHSGAPKKYKCGYCNYATHMKGALIVHNRIHTNEKPFQCTYKDCRCAPGQEEICECDTCGYATSANADLKKHVLVKHSGEPKRYKCGDCKYATHTKRSLVQHSYTHTNDRPFRCTYKNCICPRGQEGICECGTCEYATTAKYSLRKHILVKHCDEPKWFECRDCKYTTHTKKSLLLHHQVHENRLRCRYKNCTCAPGQEKFCKCDMCGYVATEGYKLKIHVLVRHSTEQKSTNVKDP